MRSEPMEFDFKIINESYINKKLYKPPNELKITLQNLAQSGPSYFYNTSITSNSSPSFANQLIDYFKISNVDFTNLDLEQYLVSNPKPLLVSQFYGRLGFFVLYFYKFRSFV